MENIFLTYIIPAICWVLVTGIPAVITYVKNAKAYRTARAEAEQARTEQERAEAAAKVEAAKNAIHAETKRLVAEAEATYREIDTMLKRSNSSAGSLKKGYVVTALKAFCLENGYSWNAAEMDDAIESEVAYTKTVNGKTA